MVSDDAPRSSGIRGIRHRLLGPRAGDSPARAAADRTTSAQPALRQVLFVCIGNSCRSQMAEAFAKKYGADVMVARSAGIAPAVIIAPMTRHTLAERNILIDGHFPKVLDMSNRDGNELVINMSGTPLKLHGANVIEWEVQDPIGLDENVFRAVADQIEGLVMRLIMDLRSGSRKV